MTRSFTEVLLVVPAVLCTGFLVFIAGVIQKVMNDMDEASFQNFLRLLDRRALKSPYAISVSVATWIGAIPYFIFFGFTNWWFIAGLIVFTAASVVSKSVNLPIYQRIFALDSGETSALREERRKLQSGNILRASIQFASIVLMVVGLA